MTALRLAYRRVRLDADRLAAMLAGLIDLATDQLADALDRLADRLAEKS